MATIKKNNMFILKVIVFFIPLLIILSRTEARTNDEVCLNYKCSDLIIEFPFRLRRSPFSFCGYPGFDLSCNNGSGTTIINLPNAGEFTVTAISYTKQEIYINDKDFCLPKRFLSNFSLADSPFLSSNKLQNYTYYNCSTKYVNIEGYSTVPCLSGKGYSVLVGVSVPALRVAVPPPCVEVARVLAPVNEWIQPPGLYDGIKLVWDRPSCGSCVKKGGTCGFQSFGSLEVGCFDLPDSGLPRSAKYGLIIGVGIPGVLCLIGLTSYIFSKLKACIRPNTRSTNLGSSITPQPAILILGLDGKTIESYPKTVLGESKRLPKPNDDVTCPICLGEYQPKETLRTIPECNHYFHARCIDVWLRLNAACPLCRNTPLDSSCTPLNSFARVTSSTTSSV